MGQRALYHLCPQVVRERWNDSVYVIRGSVFEHAGRIARCIADDRSSRRIGTFRGHPGKLQSNRVCQGHVAVVPIDEHRVIGRDRINQLFGGQPRGIPFRLVPITAENPLPLWRRLGPFADAPHELLSAGRVIELHAVELRATTNEVHVSVVESR